MAPAPISAALTKAVLNGNPKLSSRIPLRSFNTINSSFRSVTFQDFVKPQGVGTQNPKLVADWQRGNRRVMDLLFYRQITGWTVTQSG